MCLNRGEERERGGQEKGRRERREEEKKELRRSVCPTIEIPNYADVIQCMLDFTALLQGERERERERVRAGAWDDFRKRSAKRAKRMTRPIAARRPRLPAPPSPPPPPDPQFPCFSFPFLSFPAAAAAAAAVLSSLPSLSRWQLCCCSRQPRQRLRSFSWDHAAKIRPLVPLFNFRLLNSSYISRSRHSLHASFIKERIVLRFPRPASPQPTAADETQ